MIIEVSIEGMRVHKEIVKAWLDGAKIQVYSDDTGWHDILFPGFLEKVQYRIKPQKTLMPFSFDDQLVGKTIRRKNEDERFLITGQERTTVYLLGAWIKYEELLSGFVFLDGSTCGKEEDEP